MGYELHIVRQDNYQDEEEESKISLDEWLSYVASDKELELTNGFEMKIPGFKTSWTESKGFCNWLGHSQFDKENMPWFDYSCGCISAKYPDNETIKKMINISSALNAKVRGDDFEYYDETYFTNGGKPLTDLLVESIEKINITKLNKPWWKFW
jgi:hypothetical protein